jgi:hypothetical protein
MDTPETFLAYLQRDVNCLTEDSITVRLQSLQKLERVIVRQVDSLPTDIIDAVSDALLKPLLKRLKDKSEKCRDLSIRILKSLVECTSDLSAMLPYIFPTLVGRLGCEDLDGIAHLPEAMRPDPEQKPMEIMRPIEDSEEVRLQIAHFVAAVLKRCNQNQIYTYVDEACGLIRAECMDPFHEVKAVALETMSSFCYNHHEILLHFTEPLGRSLTSCLNHNHGKIRIGALRTLTAVLQCGPFKHNHEVIQLLMAWQDPNKCPVKAFYEVVTSVNYMANLTFDRHPAVRRFWYETLAMWLLTLQDKVDHEPYIFPYLLTGLCDENEDIALETFWLIERCGVLYEEEHEEDLRKTRQYGFDFGWTYGGRAHVPFPLQGVWASDGKFDTVRRVAASGPDLAAQVELSGHHRRDGDDDVDYGEEVELPAREYAWPVLRDIGVYKRLPRPRLGARSWVRTNTRRYVKATFNDVVDFRDCTANNAGRLLCMTLAYTEEGITEWLQPMMAAIVKFYAGRAAASGNSQCMKTYEAVCKLVGAFCEPSSYWAQLRDALDHESILGLDQRVASMRVLANCIAGSVETLETVQDRADLGMGRLSSVIPELISAMHESDLLLWPSESSRQVMWELLFSFLGSLKDYLTSGQVAKLLYVALALSAKAPAEAVTERAGLGGESIEAANFEDEELVDAEKLQRALELLSSCIQGNKMPAISLDSLDDMDDGPVVQTSSTADPRVVHKELFERVFPEVLAQLDDSFQVFRSVVYLSPLSVLSSRENIDAVLERLARFAGPAASPPTRRECQALGVHLAVRCSKCARDSSGTSSMESRVFARRIFRILGAAQVETGEKINLISYNVIVSGLSMWRRFFLHNDAEPRDLLFPSDDISKPLQWLTMLIADQELYKRYHAQLEQAEKAATGKAKEDLVVMRAKTIRETAEHRAHATRALAASTLLIALRRIGADGVGPIPWATGRKPGSARAVFLAAASLFRTAEPTIPPNFVKATMPHMILYAAEIMRLLLNQTPEAMPQPFTLQDDAARAIHDLVAPPTPPVLPLTLEPEERETLIAEFIQSLVDLNLTLPPEPNAKHEPVSLSNGSSEEITLGWDRSLASIGEEGIHIRPGTGTDEIARLLAQSTECLRWNAALALYKLGVDFSVACRDGFQRSLEKWRKRREQAKVMVAADLLHRAGVAATKASAPRALAPK